MDPAALFEKTKSKKINYYANSQSSCLVEKDEEPPHDLDHNAKKNDLFLGMTSQCIDGRVRMTVYESGRDLLDLGITPLENMTPETSLVKAMWALGNSKDVDEMKSLMLENIASEF